MNIDFNHSLTDGKRVVCAISGGADSMCLLHLLVSHGTRVLAAHYEHGIRGEESERDAKFVADYCRENGIAYILGHGDVPAYAKAHSLGIEEAARLLRYDFLEQAREKLGYDVIATAHNADDNAETLIFNLTRGSGTAGLCGIPERRGCIVRPLLGTARADIEAYLAENGVAHIEDSTNGSDDYSRNLIRHRVIPALREINPSVEAAAKRTARLAKQDEDCLSAMAQSFIDAELRGGSLPTAELLALHPAVSSRVLRLILGRGLSMERTEAILGFCAQSGYAVLDIPGRRLRREQGRLYFCENGGISLPDSRIIPGEALLLPEAGLRLLPEITDYNGEVNDLFKTSFIKYEMIRGDIFCTGRKAGDSLRLQGRGCTKTLKALFTERGYTRLQRDTTPVIRDCEGVLMAYGLGIAERARAGKGERVLKITFEKI